MLCGLNELIQHQFKRVNGEFAALSLKRNATKVSNYLLFRQPSGKSVKELSQIGPERLIRWPVLTRPPLAGFEATTEASCCGKMDTRRCWILVDTKVRRIERRPSGTRRTGVHLARSGQREDALKILTALKEQSTQRYVQSFAFALVYIGLGEKEQALD